MARITDLPVELVLEVAEYLHKGGSRQDLHALTLVSKIFSRVVQEVLVRELELCCDASNFAFLHILAVFLCRPSLASKVLGVKLLNKSEPHLIDSSTSPLIEEEVWPIILDKGINLIFGMDIPCLVEERWLEALVDRSNSALLALLFTILPNLERMTICGISTSDCGFFSLFEIFGLHHIEKTYKAQLSENLRSGSAELPAFTSVRHLTLTGPVLGLALPTNELIYGLTGRLMNPAAMNVIDLQSPVILRVTLPQFRSLSSLSICISGRDADENTRRRTLRMPLRELEPVLATLESLELDIDPCSHIFWARINHSLRHFSHLRRLSVPEQFFVPRRSSIRPVPANGYTLHPSIMLPSTLVHLTILYADLTPATYELHERLTNSRPVFPFLKGIEFKFTERAIHSSPELVGKLDIKFN